MIGTKIKDARKRAGLTQEELANLIGVKRSVISKYENGQIEPRFQTIREIANALDITITEFLPPSQYSYINTETGERTNKRESPREAFIDLMDSTAKRLNELELKQGIDESFERLNIEGKRELFKVSMTLARDQYIAEAIEDSNKGRKSILEHMKTKKRPE